MRLILGALTALLIAVALPSGAAAHPWYKSPKLTYFDHSGYAATAHPKANAGPEMRSNGAA